jgi:lambda family phage tail tape measure protein
MSADITTLGIAVESEGVETARSRLIGMSRAGNEAEKSVGGAAGAAGRYAGVASDAAKSAESMATAVAKGGSAALMIDRAITAAVETVVQATKAMFNLALSVGHYQDIADRTMSDPAGLASLEVSARVANTSVESVSHMIERMNRMLSQSDREDRGAVKALKSIGIEIRELRGLSGDEQIRRIAVALSGYADTQQKLAVVQAITGRGGAQYMTFLKELAQEQSRVSILTNEQIKMSDDLSDSMARGTAITRQHIQAISVEMLPAVNAVVKATNAFLSDLLGLDSAQAKLAASKALREFAFGVAESFAFAVDAVDGLVRAYQSVMVMEETRRKIDGVVAEKGILQGWDEMASAAEEGRKRIAEILGRPLFSEFVKREIAEMRRQEDPAKRAFRTLQEALRGDLGYGDRYRPELAPQALGGAAGRERKSEEQKAFDQIVERAKVIAETNRQEIDSGEKLTATQRLKIDVTRKYADLITKLTPAHRALIDAEIQQAGAEESRNVARKETAALLSEQAEAVKRLAAQEEARATAAESRAGSAADAFVTDMLNKEEAHAYRTAKILEEVKRLRAEAVTAGETGQDAIAAAYGREASALERVLALEKARLDIGKQRAGSWTYNVTEGIREYIGSVEDAARATQYFTANTLRGLEDVMVQFFSRGKADVKSFVDAVIAEMMRLAVIRPLLQAAMGLVTFTPSAGATSSTPAWDRVPDTGDYGGGLSLAPDGRKVAARSGGAAVVYNQTVNNQIDSRTDAGQIADMISEGIRRGNAQFAREMKEAGVF